MSLLLKFIGFFRSLIASPSSEVVVVALLAARAPWVAGPAQLRAALERAEVREVLTSGVLVSSGGFSLSRCRQNTLPMLSRRKGWKALSPLLSRTDFSQFFMFLIVHLCTTSVLM